MDKLVQERHGLEQKLHAVGTAVGIQQKMMRHADVTTTMNVYGKGMMDAKLDAHTKLLEYARVGFCEVAAELSVEPTN
jgi:integrase